jgi:hypothetical protein
MTKGFSYCATSITILMVFSMRERYGLYRIGSMSFVEMKHKLCMQTNWGEVCCQGR